MYIYSVYIHNFVSFLFIEASLLSRLDQTQVDRFYNREHMYDVVSIDILFQSSTLFFFSMEEGFLHDVNTKIFYKVKFRSQVLKAN